MFGQLLNMKPLSLYADVILVTFKKSFYLLKIVFCGIFWEFRNF